MRICEPYKNELIRVIHAGRDAPVSEALRTHLNHCAHCSAAFHETRRLLVELGDALRPEPLPLNTVLRIRSRLDALSAAPGAPVRRVHRASVARLRFMWSAVAAAMLLVAWNIDRLETPVRSVEPATPALSDAESALVAEAFAWLYVDDATDVHLEYASERLDTLRERLSGGERALPWDADDDWDMPRSISG